MKKNSTKTKSTTSILYRYNNKIWSRRTQITALIAMTIKPIGKLFHIISNISYLSLHRFGIDLSFRISPLNYTNQEGICYYCCTSAKFPQQCKLFRTKFPQFPGVLALCWSLCCYCWWGGGWAITIFISIIKRSFCCCSCTFDSKLVSHLLFLYPVPFVLINCTSTLFYIWVRRSGTKKKAKHRVFSLNFDDDVN